MIECKDGLVVFDGDSETVMAEFISVIVALRRAFAREVGEENADKMIAEAGRIAYMSEEELIKEMDNE